MSKLLSYSLWIMAIYFVFMATAHFFGIKLPLLFVYYDTPYYAYQDKIISFAVLAYVGLFALAARDIKNVPAALIVLGMTVLGLSYVNISNDLRSVMTPEQSTWPYWAQTIMFGGGWLYLFLLYRRDTKAV